MHPFASRRLIAAILALPVITALPGCFEPSNSEPRAATTTTLSVTPSLGLVRNATVVVKNAAGATVGTGSTDNNGTASVVVTGAGPYIVEVQGDADAEYFDEKLGAFVAFPSGSIHALVPAGTTNVGVTGLTELAHKLWSSNAVPLSAANITAANGAILNAFAPSAPAGFSNLLTPPRVIGATPAAGDLAANAADLYAAILAGLAQSGTGSTPALSAIQQIGQDIADGTLDGQADGTPIPGIPYNAGTFATYFQTQVDGRRTAWGTTDLQSVTLNVAAFVEPSFTSGGGGGSGGAGYPPAGVHTAQVSTGAACSVTVSGHDATVSALGYTYTVTLDGHVFESTGGTREIGPGIIGTGTVRNYAGYDFANHKSIDINLDGNDRLIYAYASYITNDSPTPPAGANVFLVCAGTSFTGNLADLPPSGPNAAAASNFTATALVGTYNAPYNTNGTGTCTFGVDASGNLSLTQTPAGNGITVPYTDIVASTQTTASVQWEYHPGGPDWYLFDLHRQPDGSTVMGILLNGSLSKTCSTGNDPAAKWAVIGAQSGSYTGTTKNGTMDMAHGGNHACSLMIEPSGDTFYTASTGEHLNASAADTSIFVGKTTLNNGNPADNIEAATFSITLDLPHKLAIATKDYTYYDYCNLN